MGPVLASHLRCSVYYSLLQRGLHDYLVVWGRRPALVSMAVPSAGNPYRTGGFHRARFFHRELSVFNYLEYSSTSLRGSSGQCKFLYTRDSRRLNLLIRPRMRSLIISGFLVLIATSDVRLSRQPGTYLLRSIYSLL
jgi:hypothetical protein